GGFGEQILRMGMWPKRNYGESKCQCCSCENQTGQPKRFRARRYGAANSCLQLRRGRKTRVCRTFDRELEFSAAKRRAGTTVASGKMLRNLAVLMLRQFVVEERLDLVCRWAGHQPTR